MMDAALHLADWLPVFILTQGSTVLITIVLQTNFRIKKLDAAMELGHDVQRLGDFKETMTIKN